MFQLVCDPSGAVVETSLKKLVPAVISWGNKLDHILRVVLSHILGSAQVYVLLIGCFHTIGFIWKLLMFLFLILL